jgi:hypothetical protein
MVYNWGDGDLWVAGPKNGLNGRGNSRDFAKFRQPLLTEDQKADIM